MSRSILGEEKIRSYNFINGVWETERLVDSLRAMTRCEETSAEYRGAVKVLCTDSMFSLAVIVASGILFGFVMPVLICIIPQMWRRMTNRAYYKYHTSGPSIEEANPFIPLSGAGGHQVRSNISAAARQFNESPSFQRLVTTNQSTLSRNRSNAGGSATMNRNNNNNHNSSISHSNHMANQNLYATTTMGRVEDYLASSDAYSMYSKNVVASAPPPASNYSQSIYGQSNYASSNVPIVLYPNQSGTRTLSNRNGNMSTLMRNQVGELF